MIVNIDREWPGPGERILFSIQDTCPDLIRCVPQLQHHYKKFQLHGFCCLSPRTVRQATFKCQLFYTILVTLEYYKIHSTLQRRVNYGANF